LVLYL